MNPLKRFKETIFLLQHRKPYRFPLDLFPSWMGKSSVLILFFEEEETIKVILTKRSSNLNHHKGEVCFPGGKLNNNETFVEAALRESQEEIGIDPTQVEVLGRLDDTWSGSGFQLIAFVGWYHGVPSFRINEAEVAEIILFDLKELLLEQAQRN